MKRFFRFVMAAAVIFSAVSCAKEDISSSIGGGEVEVTFTANLADMGTRAYGEANNVNVVYLGIYDKDGDYLDDLTDDEGYPVDPIKHTASIPVVLLKDKTYDLVFWAQSSEAPANCYSMDWTARRMTVTYGSVSQDDKRDAFFLVDNEFVAGDEKNPEFHLYRPFAQLNAGLSDDEVTKIGNNGVDVSKIMSQVKVKNVANVLNLVDEADDNVATDVEGEVEAEFTIALKPEEALKVSEVNYEYLSMNYLLVNKKQNVTAEYIFTDFDGTTYTRKYDNVPLQRNYRTNIVGNLLSSEYDFNVVIVPGFNEPANNYVTTIEDLQLILDNAKADKNNEVNEVVKIVLGADMKGDVTVVQKEGLDFIIDGNEKKYKFDGTITINGDARSKGTETLTITNVNFVTESKKDFISAPTKVNSKYNYSHNVTVDNCTFSSPAYNEEIVGIKLLTTYNAVVKNCTATNIHTLAQFQSTDNATVIENVKVVNCKNGISLGNMASATITNAEISANGYGVRLDGAKEREVAVTIENATINAYIPVNVRKMNDDACKATVKFEGENNLTGATYEIAFCSNEYEDGVAPAAPKGTFTLDGAEGFDAYVGPITSASALDAAINSNGDVTVESPINSVGTGFEVERDVVLDFDNNVLNAGSDANSRWYALEIYGEKNVEIHDANFTRAGVFASEGANVVFNSGVINHKPERTSRYIFAANSGATITINGGTFTNDRAKNSFFWADNSTIYVKGGNFGGVASNKKVVTSNGGQVIITGGTFNFDPTAWVPEGYEAQKKGSKWQVVKKGSSIVTTTSELQSAIANAKDGDIIALAVGTYEGTFNVRNNVTIESAESNNKATIKGRVNIDSNGNGATFKNLMFDINDDSKVANVFSGAAYQYPAIVVIYAAATNFENCEFKTLRSANVTSINYGSHTAGCVLNVNNCSFVGDFYAIRSRTLFSITNSDFNIHTDATLAAVFTWGNANSGANSVVFTGNNNSSGYNTMGVMLSSTTFPYDNISYNVQGNTNFVAFKDSINPACSVTGSTFADGSETF